MGDAAFLILAPTFGVVVLVSAAAVVLLVGMLLDFFLGAIAAAVVFFLATTAEGLTWSAAETCNVSSSFPARAACVWPWCGCRLSS